MGAGGAAIGVSALGALAQSRGAKKAAEGSAPQIPRQFAPFIGQAANLALNRLNSGFRSFPGQLTAGQTGLQSQGLDFARSFLGQGGAGLQNAQQVVQGAAESGLQQSDVQQALSSLQPLSNFQLQRGLGGIREREALGGRIFSSGAQRAEGDFRAQHDAQLRADVTPLAFQNLGARLGAADQLFRQAGQAQGIGGAAFQLGEGERGLQQQDIDRRFQEFLRTRPENAIGLFASLLGGGGTPFFNPVVPPNLGMTFGAGLSGLGQSPGFLNFLQGAFQGKQPTPSGGIGGGIPGAE